MEKEVVLLDQSAGTEVPPGHVSSEHTPIDSSESQADLTQRGSSDTLIRCTPGPRVLKIIRKTEVQVLCTQHNPVRCCTCSLDDTNATL